MCGEKEGFLKNIKGKWEEERDGVKERKRERAKEEKKEKKRTRDR